MSVLVYLALFLVVLVTVLSSILLLVRKPNIAQPNLSIPIRKVLKNIFRWGFAFLVLFILFLGMKGCNHALESRPKTVIQRSDGLNLYTPRKPPQDMEFVLRPGETTRWFPFPRGFSNCLFPGPSRNLYVVKHKNFLGEIHIWKHGNEPEANQSWFQLENTSGREYVVQLWYVPYGTDCNR